MSSPPKGLAIIHGHFYQPPRENPWTGLVDAEASAAPEHDWNVRITKEAYEPLIPVYAALSFDFGPTLLDWMEREASGVYRAVIRADRGNALASPYHHIILPLASRRDKETEVRWGIADFQRRFGRDPAGFWLPETAVDRETLDVLAANGIQFTVLAPHQVSKPPERGLPARIELGNSRSIAVFVYDGGLSHDVAFGPLTTDANRWTEALERTPPGAIASIAVDGETFGHHHKGADTTLATVIQRLHQSEKVALTHFAAALSAHPPQTAVDLVERTSWSCAHGIERWRAACGCRIHHDRPSQQDWRAPLRAAVDWLVAEIHAIYDREGRELPEQGVLRAMTSCGWFFDDIAGLEGRQVLRYAAHAISLAGSESGRLEAGFIEKLGDARSNDPAAGSAADVFRQSLQPTPS